MSPEAGSLLLRTGVATVWLAAGALVLLPSYRESSLAYLVSIGLPAWCLWAASAAEVALAVRVALGPSSTWLVLLQVALVSAITLILAVGEPALLVHPMGVLTKHIPFLACLGGAWLLEREGWSERAIWLLRAGVAVIWITEGIFPKILFQQEFELEIARRSALVFLEPRVFLMLLGGAQAASGIAALLLRGRALVALLWLQVAALVILPALVTLDDPSPWFHPLGPLTKNMPILVGTALLAWRGVESQKGASA